MMTTTQNVSQSAAIIQTGTPVYGGHSEISQQAVHVPSSVKSSQSKHIIGGMLPHNVISASAVASARNSLNQVNPSATPNGSGGTGVTHFRPNNELKNHMLNLSSNNVKNLQIAASGGGLKTS
jgi:hypothetical protein